VWENAEATAACSLVFLLLFGSLDMSSAKDFRIAIVGGGGVWYSLVKGGSLSEIIY